MENKYYYFGKDTVYCFQTQTDDFEALTKKQIAFYEKCLAEGCYVTNEEIRNCKKTIIEFDLEAYKGFQISQMSMISLSESDRVFPAYQRRNCDLNVYSNSTELLENEKQMAIALRNEFYRLKAEIQAAETKESVDEIVQSNRFTEIADSFNFKGITNETEIV